MEKRTYSNCQNSFVFILFLFTISFLNVSCNKSKNEINNKMHEIDNAIALTSNNETIKDTLNNLKNIGAEFIVCYVDSDENYNKICFDNIHFANSKIRSYKIQGDFKLKVIQGIDVLFTDFEHRPINNNVKSEKRVKELLKNGIITFDGPALLTHDNSINFVFCKKDENNFKCFTYNMIGKAERLAYEKGKPFFVEMLYPKCK